MMDNRRSTGIQHMKHIATRCISWTVAALLHTGLLGPTVYQNTHQIDQIFVSLDDTFFFVAKLPEKSFAWEC